MDAATKQALVYLQQALNDYANTLPPSVRGPFIKEADAAFMTLDAALTPPTDHA